MKDAVNTMLTLHMTRPSLVATLRPYFVWQQWPDIAAATPLGLWAVGRSVGTAGYATAMDGETEAVATCGCHIHQLFCI